MVVHINGRMYRIMEHTISYDGTCTHIDWAHENVTARQVDWFWSNMEKGFILWHPSQHEPLEWAVPPKHGDRKSTRLNSSH